MRMFIAVLLGFTFLSGCEVVPPYQSVDFGKTPDGKSYIRDTPRTWNEMRDVLEGHLTDELHSLRPQGGATNWNEFWLKTFQAWRGGGLEHPEKYTAYIVQRRRELGLPELVFPPGESYRALPAPDKPL